MQAWVMQDEQQALQTAALVCWDEQQQLDEESKAMLLEVLDEWVGQMRSQARTELMSASARSAAAHEAARQIVQRAARSGGRCTVLELLPGRALVLAPSDVVREHGARGVLRQAHLEALRAARQQGRPHNSAALKAYEEQQPFAVPL